MATIQEKNGQRELLTESEFREWQGSDNMTVELLEELLLDIVNGTYSIEDFLNDVKNCNEPDCLHNFNDGICKTCGKVT